MWPGDPACRVEINRTSKVNYLGFIIVKDIEECLKVVIQAVRKSDLPASESMAWCRGMLKKDRVGFICEEQLKALQADLEASGSE